MFLCMQVSESVEMHATKPREHNQPQLFIQGCDISGTFVSYNIVCENVVCAAGTSLAESMDYLFKMYWVFEMHYPAGLQIFFKFLQCMYNISQPGERVPNRICELRQIMQLHMQSE